MWCARSTSCPRQHPNVVGQHPNVVGFVGANIDAMNFAEPIIVLEWLDGECLQDALTAKGKNGSSWRPPKETSFSWYAPIPVHSIHFRGAVGTLLSGAADPASSRAGVRSSAPRSASFTPARPLSSTATSRLPTSSAPRISRRSSWETLGCAGRSRRCKEERTPGS